MSSTFALGKGDDLFPRLLFLQKACLVRLDAEDDVVEHREALDELEMLVHHADVEIVCVVGVVDLHDLTVFPDDAVLGLIQTKQHAHQRRFAGTVFAQQRVNFSLFKLEGDVVIGADAGEFLCDIQHLNDIFRFGQILHSFVRRGKARGGS